MADSIRAAISFRTFGRGEAGINRAVFGCKTCRDQDKRINDRQHGRTGAAIELGSAKASRQLSP